MQNKKGGFTTTHYSIQNVTNNQLLNKDNLFCNKE